MKQMGATDAGFIYGERPHAPQHINMISFYDPSTVADGTISFEAFLASVQSRLHRARTFRQKVVRVPMDLDLPYWVEDPEFNIEFHVHKTTLRQPTSWGEFWAEVSAICALPLDQARPLWALHLVEGLIGLNGIPDGAFAIVLKVHHAAVDGVAGMEIFTALHDPSPDTLATQHELPWHGETDPSPRALLGRAALNLGRSARPLVSRVADAVPRIREVGKAKGYKVLAPPEGPPTRFNTTISPRRVIEARNFPLAELRRVKSSITNATLNDVALALVGGAMREYLLTKGELPEASLIALAPISVRTKEQGGAGGNEISGMMIPIGTDIADALDRVCAVRDATRQEKEIATAIGARTLTEISEALPGVLVGLSARATARNAGERGGPGPLQNTIVSNVPGPQQPIYCCGARMISLHTGGPLIDGMGIFQFINSYNGRLTLTVFACRDMLPDPAFYGACLDNSYAALIEVADRLLAEAAIAPE